MNSIYRSLKALDKRHIVITGRRGSGKSTLFRQLLPRWSEEAIFTCARPKDGVYFKTVFGSSLTIGRYDHSLPGTDKKMRPVEEEFRRAAESFGEFSTSHAAIDEIGYLEPVWFLDAVTELMKHKSLLVTVRKDAPFLQILRQRDDVLIVDSDGFNMGCVMMASGLGKRFGGNKLMAPLGGKPVIAWAMDAAEDVFSKVVVVTRHEDVKKLCEEKNVECVLHDLPYRSDTVRLGMERMEDMTHCLFLPGDQPFVMKESLYAMALCAANQDGIWRLGGKSPVLFPKWAFEELKTLPQGKGGGILAQKYEERVCSIEEVSSWELRDIDTPQDLSCFCAGICCN